MDEIQIFELASNTILICQKKYNANRSMHSDYNKSI